jgi:hypothetical protein
VMTGGWTNALSDDEVRSRLIQRGLPESEARLLVSIRNRDDVVEKIEAILGEGEP